MASLIVLNSSVNALGGNPLKISKVPLTGAALFINVLISAIVWVKLNSCVIVSPVYNLKFILVVGWLLFTSNLASLFNPKPILVELSKDFPEPWKLSTFLFSLGGT